jgi:hypothetical protein
MLQNLIINNQQFQIKSDDSSKIQELVDDIILLSKMLDYKEVF